MQSSNDDYLIQNLNNIVTFAFVQAEEIDTGTYFCTFDAVSGDGRAYALTKLIFVPSVSFVNQVTRYVHAAPNTCPYIVHGLIKHNFICMRALL